MVYVPYKGLGPAMNDIVAGHVDMMFDTLTTSLPLHQQGRIRIIAVASPKRVAILPDVPPSRSRDIQATARSPGSA
jgi:tripartite-type tricarboxylate transporter receptor subunit TctC